MKKIILVILLVVTLFAVVPLPRSGYITGFSSVIADGDYQISVSFGSRVEQFGVSEYQYIIMLQSNPKIKAYCNFFTCFIESAG